MTTTTTDDDFRTVKKGRGDGGYGQAAWLDRSGTFYPVSSHSRLNVPNHPTDGHVQAYDGGTRHGWVRVVNHVRTEAERKPSLFSRTVPPAHSLYLELWHPPTSEQVDALARLTADDTEVFLSARPLKHYDYDATTSSKALAVLRKHQRTQEHQPA